jgi:hypothetical protein
MNSHPFYTGCSCTKKVVFLAKRNVMRGMFLGE